MFSKETYTNRRIQLKKSINSGLLLFPGNNEASYNYPANTYHFRQDSNFLYFFGINHPDFFGVIDVDNDKDYIFGNDVDIDDIIWMGDQPSVKDQAAQVGVSYTEPFNNLFEFVSKAIQSGRTLHFTAPYRAETANLLEKLTGIHHTKINEYVSEELIKGIVKLREVKEDCEVEEIEKMVDVAYKMHTTAMKMAMPGTVEQEIAGTIEGISLAHGGPVSFPVILSMDGQTLHNHYHGNTLEEGRLMVTDAGAESFMNYSSDITRTVPVGGKFDQRQKEIYEIVLKANMKAIEAVKPGIFNKELHVLAAKTIAQGLKDAGLMKGDVHEAVKQGAHALFFPHGLGHQMGLDVHDMENLGEKYVGYDNEVDRSTQFGLAFLRFGKRLKKGFVFTIEPGIYFIPALIDQWKAENKHAEFINYDKVESYKDFGGIRIEDDILVTDNGYRVLGKPIPKTVAEIEATMAMPV